MKKPFTKSDLDMLTDLYKSLDKNAIGLNNVDNTSDVDKPISTLQATAIGLKEDVKNIFEEFNLVPSGITNSSQWHIHY